MFERLHMLYSQGKISDLGLDRAVFKGWLTQVEATKIRNTPYEEKTQFPLFEKNIKEEAEFQNGFFK